MKNAPVWESVWLLMWVLPDCRDLRGFIIHNFSLLEQQQRPPAYLLIQLDVYSAFIIALRPSEYPFAIENIMFFASKKKKFSVSMLKGNWHLLLVLAGEGLQ